MAEDKKMLVSIGDMIFWIVIFTAMGFLLGMFVSTGFVLHDISAKIESSEERLNEAEQKREELIRKIDKIR